MATKTFAVTSLLISGAAAASAFSACGGDDVSASPSDAGAGEASSSSSSSSGGSTSDAPGGNTGCAAIASAQCKRSERCNPILSHAVIGELAECEARLTIVCERATAAPGATPYPAACVTALESTPCEAQADVAAACNSSGALAAGASCEFGRQCATGHCGGVGGSEFCGQCSAGTNSLDQEGEACENDDCDRGLSCIGYSTNGSGGFTEGKCEKTRALGAPCTDSEDCNPGGQCRGDFCWLSYGVACIGGVCATPLEEGAVCTNLQQCNLRNELSCSQFGDAGERRCQKWPFAAVNEKCVHLGNSLNGGCIGTARCVGDAGAQSCVAAADDGAPCSDDRDCRQGAFCLGGTCTIPPADRCK